MARKYPKVSGYWVYSIQIPSVNKYYIGVSKQKCSQRWNKKDYKNSSLEPYLDEWQDMEKKVLIDGLTKEESLKLEDDLIQVLSMNNLCINSNRSGLIANDKNAYQKELMKNNSEYYKQYHKQYNKQYYENNKEKWKEYQKQRILKKKQQQTAVP